MSDEDRPLDAHETAEFLGAHVETIRRLARKGEIPAYKIGKDWRFRRNALLRWAETHHVRSARPTVLVVDDEPAIRVVVRRVLEDSGYRVTTAASGAEALRAVQADRPDVVIIDLVMPGMDGVTVLEKIREQGVEVPAVIHTGYPDSTLMARALKFSPVLLLAKPAPRAKMVEAVQLALGKTRGAGVQGNTTSGKSESD